MSQKGAKKTTLSKRKLTLQRYVDGESKSKTPIGKDEKQDPVQTRFRKLEKLSTKNQKIKDRQNHYNMTVKLNGKNISSLTEY